MERGSVNLFKCPSKQRTYTGNPIGDEFNLDRMHLLVRSYSVRHDGCQKAEGRVQIFGSVLYCDMKRGKFGVHKQLKLCRTAGPPLRHSSHHMILLAAVYYTVPLGTVAVYVELYCTCTVLRTPTTKTCTSKSIIIEGSLLSIFLRSN